MKILHIPTGGLFSDGIGTFIYSYLEYMNLNEIEVTILATNKPLLEDKIKFKTDNFELNICFVNLSSEETTEKDLVNILSKFIKKEGKDEKNRKI